MISSFPTAYDTSSSVPPLTREDSMPHGKSYKEADTEEVASFLLSLKHRSVTPEPSVADETSSIHQGEQHHGFGLPTVQEQPQQACVDKTPASMMEEHQMTTGEIDVEALVRDSKLVLSKDRDLVPDALFVAMAQMRPCKLTQADRVGCYKSREIGFVGMCCMNCSGQPGFGRYFPNSVRSLAQTTTSQTILKHVGSKCRFCPPHIRHAVNELQRQQAQREGMSTGRPRYGSRKIFFQRVWARLHGGSNNEEEEDHASKATASLADDASNQTPSDLESERDNSPNNSDDEDGSSYKSSHKRGLGFLSTQKNKRSHATADGPAAKRPRGVSS